MSERQVRLKTVASIRSSGVDKHVVDGELAVRLCNYVDVYRNERITNKISFSIGSVTAAELHRFRLHHNDVVITKDSETPDDIGVPALLTDRIDQLVCAYHLAILRPGETIDGRYLQRVLQTSIAQFYWRTQAKGVTRFALSVEDIGDFLVPERHLAEQRRIAEFLDARCAAIDAAIEKKERMLEAAEARVASTIDQLIRHGTVPGRTFTSVDTAWIDRLPEGWGIERNAVLFDERDDRGAPHLPVLSVSLVSGVGLRDFANDRIQPQMSDFAQYKVARHNDIVFNKMRMWQGAVGVAPVDGLVSPDYTVLRPRTGVNPHYYAAMFRTRAYTGEVARYSHGIALDRNRIYWTEFKAIRSLVPPADEQSQIADAIGAAKSASSRLTTALTRSIAALREYRTALITAAVTGKLELPAAPTAAVSP